MNTIKLKTDSMDFVWVFLMGTLKKCVLQMKGTGIGTACAELVGQHYQKEICDGTINV